MGFMKRMMGGWAAMPVFAPPVPDRRTYVVGDIHGRDDLLKKLMVLIQEDIQDSGTSGADVVFAGDYVDRGEQSADVLARLRRLQAQSPGRVTCLMGNHERMMLDFIADPETSADLWLGSGGVSTLSSYGIAARPCVSTREARELAQKLTAALPEGTCDWLSTLPKVWQSGTLSVVHASADPDRSIEDQPDAALLWGHPEFKRVPRADGLWVAYGHTVVDQADADQGRIALDTGAYFTGRLTAAVVEPGDAVRFLQT